MNPCQSAEIFDLGGQVLDVQALGSGLVNDTFLVIVESNPPRRAVLQRINRRVFTRPGRIMQNLRVFSEHLSRRQTADLRRGDALQFPPIVQSRDGRDFFVDPEGGFWRAIGFLDNTRVVDRVTDNRQAEAVGLALGRFHDLVSDLDPARLRNTLPGFHLTTQYLKRYHRITSSKPTKSANTDLSFCRAFVERRWNTALTLDKARGKGLLLARPTHGDPKLDNMLFDPAGTRVSGIIDLDTLQPGLIQHDIGDCLRSCCATADEAYAHGESMAFDLDICRDVLKGYGAAAGHLLSAQDVSYLYPAIWIIPFELGVRFLTDFLEGNRYFKVASKEQNLHRALGQFLLTESIERRQGALQRILGLLKRGG